MTRLYTIGHSNRPLDAFIALLQGVGVEVLVDVRQLPQSQRQPQFGEEYLRDALDQAGIQYHWAGRPLGGHRPTRPDSPHRALSDSGLRGYADYMEGDPFKKGIVQLLTLANRSPTSIMCAEREPLQCHRSLIADYLTLAGAEVIHLIDAEQSLSHQLRSEARRESQSLIYDRFATAELPLT
ncbi:MAG: DUF488 domain-containing protein [Thiohalobacteraceae bacterium]